MASFHVKPEKIPFQFFGLCFSRFDHRYSCQI